MRPWCVLAALALSCTATERAAESTPTTTPHAGAAPSATRSLGPASEFDALYYPADPTLFEKKRPPREGEWLARFKEPGQSFLRYQSGKPIRPTAERSVIVLQPLGIFDRSQGTFVEEMREVMAAFFALRVEVRKPLPLPTKGRRTKRDGDRVWTQHHTRVLLDEVLEPHLPKNAVVYVGVTLEDLYPDPSWNFVFGQATLEDRVGVYSLARFFPAFWGRPVTPESDVHAWAKSAQILVHETGHAFSLAHCTEYECVMNGSNSQEELDGQFGELCPVCLRKLAWNIGFEPKSRYEKLREIYRRKGVGDLERWLDRRLAQLGR